MDYAHISNLVTEIKYEYVATGEWNSDLCNELFTMTRQIPAMVCRKRGIPMDDQPDLIQFAFQEVFRNMHRIEDNRTFPRYLYVIAENICRGFWRKQYRSVVTDRISDENRELSAGETSRKRMEDAMLREDLRDAVAALPDMYREVIELFYFAGMSSREISEQMKTSINTITSRIRRAREMLKRIMEEAT